MCTSKRGHFFNIDKESGNSFSKSASELRKVSLSSLVWSIPIKSFSKLLFLLWPGVTPSKVSVTVDIKDVKDGS